MSTHGAPQPSGATYYGASYRASGSPPAGQDPWADPGSTHAAPPRPRPQTGAHAAPPRPRPNPGPAYAPPPSPTSPGSSFAPSQLPPSPGPGFATATGYEPSRYETGAESDGFPPMDPDGFGPGRRDPAVPSARPGRGLPIVIGVLAVVLVLCVGGGAAAYFFFIAEETPADRPAAAISPSAIESVAASAPPASSPSPSASASKRPAGGEEEVSGDLSGYKQGDCLTVDEADDNRVTKARCTDPDAHKVLLRKNGTLDDSVCQSTEATFSLSQDASGTARDFVLCVGPAD
jgi:hypothetical protein